MTDSLDDQLKAVDPDRWLSSRFIGDQAARADVVALYLLDAELAAVADKAANPLMGEIRFAWWREGLEAAAAGQPSRDHPVLAALSPALASGAVALEPLLFLVAARHAELASPWFEDERELDEYLDDTAGELATAVIARLDPSADISVLPVAAKAHALTRLAQRPIGAPSSARDWRPTTWQEVEADELAEHLGHKLAGLLEEARQAPPLPPRAFPAIAHAALVACPDAGPLRKRMAMTLAVARGRI